MSDRERAGRDAGRRPESPAGDPAPSRGGIDPPDRRYRTLFDNAPLPLLTTDTDGRILEANHASSELIGRDPQELRATSLLDYLTGESDLHGRIRRLAGGRPVRPWESELRPAGGNAVPVEVSARLVESQDTEGAEIQWVIQDVRARRESGERERELHREQAARAALEQVAGRARFLSDASARLMGVLDPDRVWAVAAELAGEQAEATLLLATEDEERVRVRGVGGSTEGRRDLEPLLGTVLDLKGRTPERVPLGAIRVALELGQPEVVPAPENPPDSAGACLVLPIDSHGNRLGAMSIWLRPRARIGEELLVARNLADRVAVALESAAMFQELARARREAEEASTAEADFLSIVSHELRTPLTAIVSYAELLEDRAAELPEKLERYAHQIAAAAEHQRQLVEQILSYKRVQREGAALEPEELDFRKVVRSAVAMVQPQVGSRRLEVNAVVPDAPVPGFSDRGKLQQILTNLLSNAIRHTAEGHVRLSLIPNNDIILLEVEDTGEGIDEEALPRIFDRFWRGTGGVERQGGSGLGLTITRELVHHLHGEIQVESERGVGTRFTVHVPRRMDPPDAELVQTGSADSG